MAYIGNSPTEQLYVAFAEKYSGNGSNTTFNLSRNVGSVNDIEVVVAGSQKNPFTEYSISANGTQVIFNSAPAVGTDNIVVSYRNYVVTTFVPEDGSIIASMIQANAVTTTKIADSAVTTAKIADNYITTAKIAPGTVIAADILDGTVDNNKLLSANITGEKLVANTITSREIADGEVKANNLASTAVTPGTYGGAERIPIVVVDQQGRLTSAANVSIQQPLPNILMLSGM